MRAVETPINFVSVQDVAAVSEYCLLDPTTSRHGIDSPARRTSHASTLVAQGADKVNHVPLGALRVLQHLAEPFFPAFARPSSRTQATRPPRAWPDKPRPHLTLEKHHRPMAWCSTAAT